MVVKLPERKIETDRIYDSDLLEMLNTTNRVMKKRVVKESPPLS